MAPNQAPILLTGVTGQVGGELLPLLQTLGPVVAPARAELDLGDLAAVRAYVRQVRPRWIVNPAAYTAVDKAEGETEAAFALNRDCVQVLGEEAARLGAPVLHFSTDYVFSGAGTEPWQETDATSPLNVYGASKLAGEQALAATGAPHLIFRTSWVFGPEGRNFLTTILRLAAGRDELRIVADQHGAPTPARALAALAAHVITTSETKAAGRPLAEVLHPVSGVYHAVAAGETTWLGFASRFVELAAAGQPEQRFARLLPIATADYPTPARRPLNSRLNCGKLESTLGYRMPPWDADLAATVAEAVSHSPEDLPH